MLLDEFACTCALAVIDKRSRLRYKFRVKLFTFARGFPGWQTRFKHHVMRYALTCPRLRRSARARVYQALYFDSTAIFTVCIHRLGTTVNISLSACKHSQLRANLYRHSTFE